MGYYDDVNFIKELSEIVLPDTIVVPKVYESACSDLESLVNVSFIGIYGQAQRTLRAMAPNLYSHDTMRDFAERFMGLVNPYLLCEQGLHSEFTPDNMLKLMAMLGELDKAVGRPVATITISEAYNPPVIDYVSLDDPDYWSKRSDAYLYDIDFMRNKRAEVAKLYGEDKRPLAHAIGQKFIDEKYGTYVRKGCEPITHEKFPWDQSMIAEIFWEANMGLFS